MSVKSETADTRDEETRIYDEAIRAREDTHRKDRLSRSFEQDPIEHIKSCEPCKQEVRSHAEWCKDGKLLLTRIE